MKIIAKYSIKLYKKDVIQDFAKTMFLNIISVVVTNPEFTEESYKACINKLKEFFPKIIEKYKECYPEDKNVDDELNSMDIFKYSNDVLESIKFGDKTLKDFENHVPVAVRDMYKIMLVVSKSISINLLYLETFGKNYEEAYITVLKFYDFINKDTTDIQLLKKEIISASEIDRKLANILKDAQIELYGKQRRTNVSYSTRMGKVVLVLGSNIKELENILEALKDYDIDVYTHDNMMLAHTFPKFSQYEKLRGQYGRGIENCLLDFATFPGVIILTKNSLHNIENLYRGRLFTTDETIPNGVLQIKNNDFSEVIKSALNAKGFKTGKTCESEAIGYDIDKLIAHIKNKIDNKNYSHIFFIGADKDSADEKGYFEKLMKLAGNKVLFLSFFYNFKNPNCVNINACFERYCIVDIFDRLKDTKIPMSVFYPKCDKNTISQMVYLYNNSCNNVFVGTCTPIILNPTLIKALSTVFKIHSMTTPKKDFNLIMKQSE